MNINPNLNKVLSNIFATDLGSFGAAIAAYKTKNKPRTELNILLLFTKSNILLTDSIII
jgi:hypothetical protein